MMILLTIIIIVISIIEIMYMINKNYKKEIILYIIIAVLTLGIGYYYLSDPFGPSIAETINSLLNKDL